jgi:hypothetical protein
LLVPSSIKWGYIKLLYFLETIMIGFSQGSFGCRIDLMDPWDFCKKHAMEFGSQFFVYI